MLTDIVSYKAAKELAKHDLYYYDPMTDYYAVENGKIISNDEEIIKGDLIHYTELGDVNVKYIPAPTYANVLDALSIAGMNLILYYKNGFIGFTVEKQNKSAKDTVVIPDHYEDESLEKGILDACELLDLYPNVFNTLKE